MSYNKRLSHLISILLTDVYVGEKTVCSSTEELLAEVEKLNRAGIDASDIIGSMDVEALWKKYVRYFSTALCNLKDLTTKNWVCTSVW